MEENNQEHSAPPQHHPEKNTLMAILSYIGPLVVISFLVAKHDPFVKYHIKQGLLLFIAEVASWMLAVTLLIFLPLLQLINLAILVFAVIGIINAAQGKEKPLPLVGHLARSFEF